MSTLFPAVVVLGLGMATSVAPLTTTVMSAMKSEHAGSAAGINNAVSRVAALLAIAVLGALLTSVFNTVLDRQLDRLGVPAAARHEIDGQRSRLASAQTTDSRVRRAIGESFVAGCRAAVLVAAGLAVASAVTASLMIHRAPVQR